MSAAANVGSLMVVLQAAEKARDEAVRALQGAHAAHRAALEQAQSLKDWQQQYQSRWQTQFQRSGGAEIVMCYQNFSQRLVDALGEQDRRVEQAAQQIERKRLLLVERERAVAAINRLIERRQQEAGLRAARADQRATDEMAARATRLQQDLGRVTLGLGSQG